MIDMSIFLPVQKSQAGRGHMINLVLKFDIEMVSSVRTVLLFLFSSLVNIFSIH